jgi:co-chaperonin GroES (HSP10)
MSTNNTSIVVEPAPGFILIDDRFGTAPKETVLDGIHLPDTMAGKKYEPMAKILKVGEGVSGYAEGDAVIYKRHADFHFEVQGIQYRIIRPDSIFCKLRNFDPRRDIWGKK